MVEIIYYIIFFFSNSIDLFSPYFVHRGMTSNKQDHTICLRGEPYTFALVRRKNQKNINLRVTLQGTLEVSAPLSTPIYRIHHTLMKKESWVIKHLQKARNAVTACDPLVGITINGTPVEVVRKKAVQRSSVVYRPEQNRIIVKATSARSSEYRKLLANWIKQQAKRKLPARVHTLSEATRIPYTRVYIRNQKTRWGSSSGKGNISLNWRVIMGPEYVQDYLIIHELVHQRHHHHQARFWREVERLYPYWREAEQWLKANGVLLGLFRDS